MTGKNDKYDRFLRKPLFILIAATAFYASFSPVQAQEAQEQVQNRTYEFSISAGTLSSVISQIGKISNLEILYPSAIMRELQSDGVRGRMSSQAALDQALRGSGLYYQYVNDKTVTIARSDQSVSSSETVDEDAGLDQIFVYASEADGVGKINIDSAEIHEKYAGNMNALLRAQPGVYTRAPVDQPALTVNIRGMQGAGRVNSMIDGVPQNFRNVSGHGGTTDPLIYIDPFMVRSVDIKKGQARGADGMGALSGAANFKTLEVDDILLPDRQMGVMTKIESSDNGLDLGWLGATAARFSDDQFGTGDILAAFTYRKTGAYKDGRGNEVPGDPGIEDSTQPRSGLLKFDYSPNDSHNFLLSGSYYNNKFLAFTTNAGPNTAYHWEIDKRSLSGEYTFTPDNDLISFRAKGHIGETKLRYPESGAGSFSGRRSTNEAYGFDITNISQLSLMDQFDIKLEYGGALQADDYKGNEARGGNPDGKLINSGLFGDANIEWQDFTLNAGLRYDMWHIDGVRSYTEAGTNGCPAGDRPCPDKTFSKSGEKLNPSIGLTYEPIEGLKIFGRYALSSRAPTTSEMFSSSHDFSGLGTPAYNNLDLVPEEQTGIDIGFSFDRGNLLFEKDHFSFGMNYFHNTIENYIGVGVNPFMTSVEYMTEIANAINTGNFARMMELQAPEFRERFRVEQMQYQNAAETVKMKGIELSTSYDAGMFYINGSAAFTNTDQPFGDAAIGLGNDIGRIPRMTSSLDFGARLFGEKLTIGARMSHTKKSNQERAKEFDLAGIPPNMRVIVKDGGAITVPSYTLFDIYSSYKPYENVELFASVENLMDKFYRPSNTTSDAEIWNHATRESQPIAAKGRVIKIGMQLKF